MLRSLLSTRPRPKHGVHRFRDMMLEYDGQIMSGFHIVIHLKSLGLKQGSILSYLERAERKAARKALLEMECVTNLVQ